jgi:hypothetical protein
MRERSQSYDDLLKLSTISKTTYAGTCASPYASTTTEADWNQYEGTYTSKVMHDVVTPQYSVKSAKGVVVNNPMDSTTTIDSHISSGYQNTFLKDVWDTSCNPDKNRRSGDVITGVCSLSYLTTSDLLAPPTVDEASLISKASTEAWANVDSSSAQALMMLAEGRETIRSMCYIFTRLLKILRAAKKLRFKELGKELSNKELAQRWMELRYSIRPLIYDVNDILDTIKGDTKMGRRTFRGYESASASDSDSWTETKSNHRWIDWERDSTCQVDVRAGILTDIELVTTLNLWGFDQLAETLWEIIPFSFIVDWFFNVGKTIASWTPEGGLRTLASWVVVTKTTTQSIRMADSGISSYTPATGETVVEDVYDVSGRQWIHTVIEKSRIPSATRSFFPKFDLRLDLAKLLDLIIIGKQMFR